MNVAETAIQPRWWKPDNAAGTGAGEARAPQAAAARCGLCAHFCRIPAGETGLCGARGYDGKTFSSPLLGRFSSLAVDPIEKKPLYHWRPGTRIFSLGSLGCNMRCPFCQNFSIAQASSAARQARAFSLTPLSPAALAREVTELRLSSVAYTYNEPALQAEYILAAAPLLREAGIATVMVTNGMFSPELARDLAPWVEAMNIDLKCFNRETYARLGGNLAAVKAAIAFMVRHGVHVEVTNLVVPGLCDSEEEFTLMAEWLAKLSPDIPLHISRYRPAHNWNAPPTPAPLLRRFAAIAGERLRRVHLGNLPPGEA